MVSRVTTHPHIDLYLSSQLEAVRGFVGNFDSMVKSADGTETEIRHGAALIAVGATEHKPDEYGYGSHPGIVTGLELDRHLMEKSATVEAAKSAVFIQCVGSREPGRPYCSRICCAHTMASAIHLKETRPEMNVTVLYRDIRTYGEKEKLYQKARELGVIFIRFDVENKPKVNVEGGSISVEVKDHILRQPVVMDTDLLVLASAAIPAGDGELAKKFKVPRDADGFFAEAHVKLAPSNFAVDGVFLAGLAHYPKPIDESIAQAQAAASGVCRLFAKTEIRTLGNTASVDTRFCSACGVCVTVCPYNAPYFIEEGRDKGKAAVNPVLCKGCGVCVSSCRSGAAGLAGFEEEQIMAMVDHAF
jgi:heterodisulfide reductase subunit A